MAPTACNFCSPVSVQVSAVHYGRNFQILSKQTLCLFFVDPSNDKKYFEVVATNFMDLESKKGLQGAEVKSGKSLR